MRKEKQMSKLGDVGSGLVDFGTVLVVSGVTACVGALVALNIARSLPADPIWAELRCVVGVSFQGDEACFAKKLSEGLATMEKAYEVEKAKRELEFEQREKDLDVMISKRNEEIAALEDRGKALIAEKGALDGKRAELAEKLFKLEELEKSSTSFNMFNSQEFKNGISVKTGIEYKSFVRNQEWNKAWCYLQAPNDKGVFISITLGNQRAGEAVQKSTISAEELAATGFSAADMEQAFGLCTFPKAVL